MNIFDFVKNYPDEEACMLHFKAQKDLRGVVCKKCGCKNHYWLKNKLSYGCKQCHSRQTLRSGTVLAHTHLPFQYWYIAMHFLSMTKKSFSASELQRQLGHKRYQPIWELCNKLRDVMGKRDNEYKLKDEIELDNAFITTLLGEEQKEEKLKRGVGSQRKSKVLVMTESMPVDNPKNHKKPKKVNHIKMRIVPDLEADTASEIVEKQVDSEAKLDTDNSKTYKNLKKYVKKHNAQTIKPTDAAKMLPWVHVGIANVKRLLLDVHHQLKKEYLQYYLNEFCYKFNRRYFGEKLFDRLVIAAVTYNTDFKSKIYNRNKCG